MIFLDTDICIDLLRGNSTFIEKRAENDADIAVSFMTVAELYYGAQKSNEPQIIRLLVEEFLLSVQVIESDFQICQKFGIIKAELYTPGLHLADADVFIAATVLVYGKKLITGNAKHFKRIPDLKIENWR